MNEDGKDVYVKRELRFIDSLRFMASSLDKLSSNLKIDQFVNLKKYYSANQIILLYYYTITFDDRERMNAAGICGGG